MRRRYIQEQWNSYLAAVVPCNASETQRRETKRAFYAGAHGIIAAIMVALSKVEETTEEDYQIMEDIQAEAEAFVVELRAGRA